MGQNRQDAKWWADHVVAWKKSGMTQTEYCQINGLNHKSFSNRKLREAKKAKSEKPLQVDLTSQTQLISVSVSEQTHGDQSGVTLIVGEGLRITLSIGFDLGTLKSVLTAISY